VTRTGRRPGSPGTRQKIVAIARRCFATRGYDATSLRSIADEAGVDPALLIHYFRNKEGLFVEAMGLPVRLSEVIGGVDVGSVDQYAETLVRNYLRFVDSERSRNAMLALVRSAVSNDKAAAMLREFLASELLPIVTSMSDYSDPQLRASLVAAQLVGVAMLRHVIKLSPIAKARPDDLVALVAPVVKGYLAQPAD
jgi:AcrR family transcriptional regulator